MTAKQIEGLPYGSPEQIEQAYIWYEQFYDFIHSHPTMEDKIWDRLHNKDIWYLTRQKVMKAKNELTLEELNAINKRWLALSCDDSEKVKREVLNDMKRIPKNYFSISSDGKKAVAMLGGVPANMAMDFEECRKYYGKECHPSFAWQNSHWVSI